MKREPWKVIAEEIRHKNPYWQCRKEDLLTPDGVSFAYYIADLPAFSIVVGVDDDGNVMMIEQYRPTVREFSLEFPAGAIDEGESPEQAAGREYVEEAGYRPGSLEYVGVFANSIGISSQKIHVFLASSLTPETAEGDEHGLRVLRKTPEEIDTMIKNGDLIDFSTVGSWMLVRDRIDDLLQNS